MYDFGENIFMNNEKYLDELDGRLQVLNELRKRIIELSKAIIGDTLYKEDFFFTSAMDRSVVLLDGISEMIKNRSLIRLQSSFHFAMVISSVTMRLTKDITSSMRTAQQHRRLSIVQ